MAIPDSRRSRANKFIERFELKAVFLVPSIFAARP